MKSSTHSKKTTKTASKATASKKKAVAKKAIVEEQVSQNTSSQSVLLSLILVGVILQLLFTIGLYFTNTSGGVPSETIEKVDRLDAFFAANAPGYGSAPSAEAPSAQAPETQTVSEPSLEGRPMIGNEDAPITIVEYSDFECPFCGKFHSETYGQLKEEYIDTGKAKLIYKDFPLDFHKLAKPAAIASKCVFKELGSEGFFAYHDTIFENQRSLSEENLKAWAVEAGVDAQVYDTCIADPAIEKMVDEDFQEGAQLGVQGTPSFVINGKLLVGAQPFSAFKQVIDAELSA
jgi:protein-disulfide isomerase